LSGADPKNALLQQGLAIAYVNTASAMSSGGHFKEGLNHAGKGLEIMRGLVASAPQNAVQKRILAEMLVARGTILIHAGKPNAAISELESARALYLSLSKAGSKDLATSVAACDVKLGEAASQAGHDAEAVANFARALMIVKPLVTNDSLDIEALY